MGNAISLKGQTFDWYVNTVYGQLFPILLWKTGLTKAYMWPAWARGITRLPSTNGDWAEIEEFVIY